LSSCERCSSPCLPAFLRPRSFTTQPFSAISLAS
jgi:hypothetical protein